MTLQVGIVGTDGIVLASDRLVNTDTGNGYTRTESTKCFSGVKTICCWSGGELAKRTALNVQATSWSAEVNKQSQLIESGNSAWKTVYGANSPVIPALQRPSNKVLVAYSETAELWELDVFEQCVPTRVFDVICAGDVTTTINHLLNHYSPKTKQPTERLIILAAHAICMGHRENSGSIAGLEVAIIPKGGQAYFLSSEQEQELQSISDSICESIGNLLIQPFD